MKIIIFLVIALVIILFAIKFFKKNKGGNYNDNSPIGSKII